MYCVYRIQYWNMKKKTEILSLGEQLRKFLYLRE